MELPSGGGAWAVSRVGRGQTFPPQADQCRPRAPSRCRSKPKVSHRALATLRAAGRRAHRRLRGGGGGRE
eukprot:1692927-Pyramimonas_sp.AAC.1